MINNWKEISLNKDSSIKNAMQALDASGLRITFVIDKYEKLIGTVTDGDIRRGLLKGLSLDDHVSHIMNTTPIFVLENATKQDIHDILHRSSILAIPVVNSDNKIIGLETIDSIEDVSYDDTPIILMAGGFGKRLHPLTENVPKPMLPLGNKPILEHIIESFKLQGFKNFYITTHYKTEVIQEYFKKNILGVNIEYVVEDEPLGTAGSLYLLKNTLNSNFIVMNADLLIKINFQNLLSFHKTHQEIATVCIKQHSYQVPFGVVSFDGEAKIDKIREKPVFSYFVNTGIYCFSKNIFEFFNKKEYMDMPTLLHGIIRGKKKISAFPIHENWVDIGSMDDYKRVQKEDR
jgi:dTDP-glucose pyrophosphorylase